MRNILDWGFDEWISAIFLSALATGSGLLLASLLADKTPTHYYLSGAPSNLVCVVAAQPWDQDTVVFCSQDPAQASAVLAKANDGARRPR